jgi:GTP-binding protein
VGGYPFTTLEPALGTLEDPEGRQLVLADIPGLIEGAAAGAGLGHEFLAHVERTRLLVHLVEVAPLDGSDPWEQFVAVRDELRLYGAGLERRPLIAVLAKADLLPPADVEALQQRFSERLAGDAVVCREATEAPLVLAVSSATGEGLEGLRGAIFRHTPAPDEEDVGADQAADGVAEHAVYRPVERGGWRVTAAGDRAYRIEGPAVERLLAHHDIAIPDSRDYVEERLRAMGVMKALDSKGFEAGDEVQIGGDVFNLYPESSAP